MPPPVKFRKEDIVSAALDLTREKGIGAVTAREVARMLGVSVGPIFTWFETMDQLRVEVCGAAKNLYREYLERGLAGPVPFLGLGQQFIRFSREEPELYKLMFLSPPGRVSGGAMEAFRFSQELARDSVMRIYRMDAETADRYFRDLWLAAFGFATLAVTGNCPYSDAEMDAVLTEISLSVCKAYKEIPGLPEGNFDRDAVFSELVRKPSPGPAGIPDIPSGQK